MSPEEGGVMVLKNKNKKIIAMYDIFTLIKQGKYIIHFKRILGKKIILGKWVKC